MKLAFSTLGSPKWSMEHTAEKLLAAGYQGVELRVIEDQLIDPAALDRSARRLLRQTFGRRGLAIAAVDTSCRFSTADAAERRQTEGALRAFLELAVDLDCTLVRTFGGEPPAGCSTADAVRRVAESLNRVAPRAEELGVRIVLETHDGFARAATVLQVLQHVQSPAVGVLWDAHHPYRMGESAAAVWEMVRERLYHVHIKDARSRPDGGWDLVLLGEGEVPVQQVVRTLCSGGYDGWLSVEWEKKWHPEIPEPEVAVPQHARLLQEYLAQGGPEEGGKNNG